MKRTIYSYLQKWKKNPSRKPLLLRGARQVGKTFEARILGISFKNCVEINFEKQAEIKDIFEKNLEPKRIIRDLELITQKKIIPGETLLFFDEIQEAPQAILALRYFFEELPALHVIAAGSLLDFALEKVGIPVGRVEFLHLYPLSFLEFLQATNQQIILEEILKHTPSEPITDIIHVHMLEALGEYLVIGGMPEAVQHWATTKDPLAIRKIHQTLLNTYRQDFHKYASKYQMKYVSLLFDQIPHQLASQFKFSKISGEYRKRELAPCLDLLEMAGVVHKVFHSSGNGIPLGAEANLDKFKTLFLDVGLAQTLLGLDIADWFLHPKEAFANKGPIIEALIGQEILAYSNPEQDESLYYWHREKNGSMAEVDYIIQQKNQVIPIEVKSGHGNTLKSLHTFLKHHPHTPFGLKISTRNYSIFDKIHAYPLYAIAKALGMNAITFNEGA